MKKYLLIAMMLFMLMGLAAYNVNGDTAGALVIQDENTHVDVIYKQPNQYTMHICQSLPQNHWNIAFYIITENTSILHRPALHDDIVYHGTIPNGYIPAIKDRARRFAEGLHTMSRGNITVNTVFYIRNEPVTIIETEEISI